jgi:hypothetical protein
MAEPRDFSRHRLKYYSPKRDEWVQPVRRGYRLACCDCGLIHNVDFRVRRGCIQFRVARNTRSTAMMRRHLKSKGKLVVSKNRPRTPAREIERLSFDLQAIENNPRAEAAEAHVRELEARVRALELLR